MGHFLLHFFGIDNESGRAYAWWSGAGSDLGEIALVGGLWAFLRHRNCEVHHCWRLGRHITAAGQKVCRKHHPDGHLTVTAVAEQHEAAKGVE